MYRQVTRNDCHLEERIFLELGLFFFSCRPKRFMEADSAFPSTLSQETGSRGRRQRLLAFYPPHSPQTPSRFRTRYSAAQPISASTPLNNATISRRHKRVSSSASSSPSTALPSPPPPRTKPAVQSGWTEWILQASSPLAQPRLIATISLAWNLLCFRMEA